MEKGGKLFIVSTPIGNLKDITFRAVATLTQAEVIFCEDTRRTKKLLEEYNIPQKKLIPFNNYNEEKAMYEAFKYLKKDDVALVSDAGTPLISDPGFRLVYEAKKRGVKVVPIPGVNAALTALSASALPTDRFTFLGFLPKTTSKARNILESMQILESTIIIYESPHRIPKTLNLIKDIFGNIKITVARELTKVHEEVFSEAIENVLVKYKNTKPKGEFVLLFSLKK